MTLGEIILQYRTEHGMSQRQFADLCKGVSNGYISMVEQGRNPSTGKPVVPSIEKLKLFADAMQMSLHDLLEQADDMPVDVSGDRPLPSNVRTMDQLQRQRVPLIGKVAAGQPIYAPEDYDAYVSSPVKCDAAIEVQGDSMIPGYQDGDMVYIRCRPDVEDGQVAVVFLDDEAVIKHVYHEPDGLLLLSDNPAYAPIRARADDYASLRVFGIPVGYTRMYKTDPLNKIRKGFR